MNKKNYLTAAAITLAVLGACKKETPVAPPDPNGFSPEIGAILSQGGKFELTKSAHTVAYSDVDTVETHDGSFTVPDTDIEYHTGAYKVTKTDNYSVVENPTEFAVLDPWSDLWPGALVQGGSLADGEVPATVPAGEEHRLPGVIYLTMVSGSEEQGQWYKETPMSGSKVTQAMNELIQNVTSSPARVSFEMEEVHSTEEMALKLGINLKMFGGKMSSTFGNSNEYKEDKTYCAVRLNQIFYTMAYESPSFGQVFTEDVRPEYLTPYTGPGNPICYVSSVSYGRSYILLYETSSSSRAFSTALSTILKVGSVEGGTTLSDTVKSIYNSSTVKLMQLGGNAEDGLDAALGSAEELKQFIIDGANVSQENIGIPLSYKINYLYDNTNVQLSNTLEYSINNTTFVPKQPEGDVVVDIYDVSVELSSADKHKVASISHAKINEIKLTAYKVDGSSEFERVNGISPMHTSVKADFPIYTSRIFNNLIERNYSRIKISTEVEFFNASYRTFSSKRSNYTRTIVQEYEYDSINNIWKALNDGSLSVISESHVDVGTELKVDVNINLRITQDGIEQTDSN